MNGAVNQVARFRGNGVNFMVACLTVKDYYANITLMELVEACKAKGLDK